MLKKNATVSFICFFIIFFACFSASARDNNSGAHFYFIQISDTHWGRGDNLNKTKKIVSMINALPMTIQCVVHTGDITSNCIDDPDLVLQGKAIMEKLEVPVHYIPGNHDILKRVYDDTKSAYMKHFGGLVTEKTYNGVVFLMVYTEPLAKSFKDKNYQPLVLVKSALERTEGKPVIVFHHTPSVGDFYNNTMHKGWKADVQKAWSDMLNAYDVKAVIAGHFHRDEHHWVGNIPLYVSSSISGAWGRQAASGYMNIRMAKSATGRNIWKTDLIRHILLQFFQPGSGFGIAGGPPVAAGGQGAAGTDLWRIGHGRPLELTDLEKAVEKHFHPALYGGKVIFVLVVFR